MWQYRVDVTRKKGTSAITSRRLTRPSSQKRHNPSTTGSITVDDLLRIAATAHNSASA